MTNYVILEQLIIKIFYFFGDSRGVFFLVAFTLYIYIYICLNIRYLFDNDYFYH